MLRILELTGVPAGDTCATTPKVKRIDALRAVQLVRGLYAAVHDRVPR